MKLSNLVIAAAVLCGLGGLIWWVNKHPQDKSTPTAASPKLMDVPDAQVQSFDLQKKGSPPLTLTKDKGKWTISAPATYSADQDAVTSLISSLSGVNADSVIEEKPGDVGKYGLADPVLTVTAHEKGGKTDRLFFGDDVPAGSEVYARVGKDPKVYAVSSSLKSSFSKDVNDLRDKRLLTFDSKAVSRVELISAKSDIEFGKVNESDWQIVKPGPYRADSFQVEELMRKLADAKMDLSGKTEDAKAVETAYNGGHVVGTVKVTDASGVQSLEVRQNKDDYYAHSSLVPGAFKIASDLGQLVGKPLDDFRNKKLYDFGYSDTSRIELHLAAGDKTYTHSGTDWKSAGQTVDPGSVQSLIEKLRDLTATGFVTAGFGNPDSAITVVSNDGKRTEKVEFAKAADGYIAQREGQPTLYKLDAKAVNDILEAAKGIKATASGAKK
jgi:hypothetical protein